MKVTRDVIIDLWPVYESNAASADTRILVEEFLRSDPEFARLIRDERSKELLNPGAVSLPPTAEKEGLARAQRMLRYRIDCLLVAFVFGLLSAFLRQYRTFSSVAAVIALAGGIGLWLWERRRRTAA